MLRHNPGDRVSLLSPYPEARHTGTVIREATTKPNKYVIQWDDGDVNFLIDSNEIAPYPAQTTGLT